MLYLTLRKETKQTICFYLLEGPTSKKGRRNTKTAKAESKEAFAKTAEVATDLLMDKYYRSSNWPTCG